MTLKDKVEYSIRYKPGNKKLLPMKLVFDLWIELGTTSLVTKKLKELGYTSKNGDLNPSVVKNTLDTYIVENYQSCKDIIFQKVFENDNTVLSDLEYELRIARTAFRLWLKPNPTRLNLWLASHPELINHEFYTIYRDYLDTISKRPEDIGEGFIAFTLAKQMRSMPENVSSNS